MILHKALLVTEKWINQNGDDLARKISLLTSLGVCENIEGAMNLREKYFVLVCGNALKHEKRLFGKAKLPWVVQLQGLALRTLCSNIPTISDKIMGMLRRNHKFFIMRLLALVGNFDWTPMRDKYWLGYALSLVLDCAKRGEALKLDSGYLSLSPLVNQHAESKWTKLAAPKALLRKLEKDLQKFRKYDTNSILNPLKELIRVEHNICDEFFVQMMPQLWEVLQPDMQETLLRKFHEMICWDWPKTMFEQGNPVDLKFDPIKTIFQGLATCTFKTRPSIECMAASAEWHNCWFPVLQITERLCEHGGPTYVSESPPGNNPSIGNLLVHLYRKLNANDVLIAYETTLVQNPNLKTALSHIQFGQHRSSHEIICAAIGEAQRDGSGLNEYEDLVAVDYGLKALKNLQQWDQVIHRSNNQFSEDYLEGCAMSNKWDQVRKFQKNSKPITVQEHIFRLRSLIDSYTSDLKQEINISKREAVACAIQEWARLPHFIQDSHIPLLFNFQDIVEADEAEEMMDICTNLKARGGPQKPDFKQIIQVWQKRQLNLWDNVEAWHQTMEWRIHIFNRVKNNSGATTQSQYNDGHWNRLKLAEISREQNLRLLSYRNLQKLENAPSEYMNGNFDEDCFMFYLEQHFEGKVWKEWLEHRAGFNLVQGEWLLQIHLERMPNKTKARAFLLFAHASVYNNDYKVSNFLFHSSVTLNPNYATAWHDWGGFCDRVFLIKKDITWVENGIACYLRAISLDYDKYCLSISRILWVLSYEDKKRLGSVFEKFSNALPSWNWIPWIPELMRMLRLPFFGSVKKRLLDIVQKYPNCLYFHLRCVLTNYKKKPGSEQRNPQFIEQASVVVQEIVANMRQMHHRLIENTEMFLKCLWKKFRMVTAEEIRNSLFRILQRLANIRKYIDNPMQLQVLWVQDLRDIRDQHFNPQKSSKRSHQDELRVVRFNENFGQILKIGKQKPLSHKQIMKVARHLKEWINMLSCDIATLFGSFNTDIFPDMIETDLSPVHDSMIQTSQLHLPGFIYDFINPDVCYPPKIVGFSAKTLVSGLRHPRLFGVICSDGRVYHHKFRCLRHGGKSRSLNEFCVVLNRFISKDVNSTSRNLRFTARRVIRVSTNMVIQDFHRTEVMFEDVTVFF